MQMLVMDDQTAAAPRYVQRGLVVGATSLGCGVAFGIDATHQITWAFGVLYIPLVCLAVFYRSRQCVWWLAAIAIGLIVLGGLFPVMDTSSPALADRGLSIGAILITATLVYLARDIQDRLATQTALAQASSRVKTQILANLSHELRTPLNAIIGFSDLLAEDCRPDQRTSVEHMRSAGRRLLITVENLLDIATDRVLRADRLDLAAILCQAAETARNAAAEQCITLLTSIGVDTPEAIGDAWAVRRIADNLVCNAVKFTPPGGTVRVATETTDGRVVAVVEDTGPGMAADVLGRLGEQFFQAKPGADRPYEGLGTGLALCRKLADAMGVKLEFASQPGKGTVARLTLRVA
jgi:signal transduction histidine kinase